MLEYDIKYKFVDEWHNILQKTLNLKNLRLYAIELDVFTDDGRKKADLVYEVNIDKIPMNNPMFVLELKKDKIDVGVCEQVKRYSHFIERQLYRRKPVQCIIAGPSFSNWELDTCKEQKIHALQYDLTGNMRLVI